jgi:hypothetical protein
MHREASIAVVMAAAAVLLAFVAFFAFRDAAPHGGTALPAKAAVATPSRPELAAVAQAALPPALPTADAPAPTARAAPLFDEAALMNRLRELRGSDPNRTLQLAREGNRRFEDSADAAERAWFIVKALSDLGHHDEARLEGRMLVDKYGATSWAEDVHRHLFVNPPTHPLERGHGKDLELDP